MRLVMAAAAARRLARSSLDRQIRSNLHVPLTFRHLSASALSLPLPRRRRRSRSRRRRNRQTHTKAKAEAEAGAGADTGNRQPTVLRAANCSSATATRARVTASRRSPVACQPVHYSQVSAHCATVPQCTRMLPPEPERRAAQRCEWQRHVGTSAEARECVPLTLTRENENEKQRAPLTRVRFAPLESHTRALLL